MFIFQNPEMLYFLLLIPLVIILHFISLYFFSKKAYNFANFETLKRLHESKNIFSKKIPDLIFRVLFIILIVFAAAGTGIWLNSIGILEDVVFAVDASGSMFADDVEPTRLDASKNALKSFIANSSYLIKPGIISFTSLGYLEAHPTYDKLKLINSIDNIKIKNSKGTSLGEAINYGIIIFGETIENEKNLIIITDGQENVLSIDELLFILKEATKRKIRVNIIGVGTNNGASMNDETMGVTTINEGSFKLITEETEGRYIVAIDENEIENAIDSFINYGIVKKNFDLSIWLYMFAFLMLIIEWFFTNYLLRSFP